MNESFLITLKNYLQHIADTVVWNLSFPALMIGGFLLLTLIITIVYCNKKPESGANAEDKQATITRKILCSAYLSGVFTLSITTVVVICLMKFTEFFGKTPCQFGVIIGYLLIGIVSFIAYNKLCQETKKRAMSLVNVPVSETFMGNRMKHLKTMLNKKLWLFLIVAAPFLLLFISNSKSSLISIVLDNSDSMHEYLPYGKNSLETVLAKSPHKGQYVFTTLDIVKSKEIKDTTVNQYFEAIVNTKNPSDLPTSTETFTDTRDLINRFSQVGDAGGSAIYQGIWQNYLTARDFPTSNFQSKKLIIISDGADNLYYDATQPGQTWTKKDMLRQKGQVGESPYDFFDGGIYGIILGETGGNNLFNDCEESLKKPTFDGTNQQSYFDALVDILPEMFFDWIFIYFIIGMLVMTFVALLIAKSTVK